MNIQGPLVSFLVSYCHSSRQELEQELAAYQTESKKVQVLLHKVEAFAEQGPDQLSKALDVLHSIEPLIEKADSRLYKVFCSTIEKVIQEVSVPHRSITLSARQLQLQTKKTFLNLDLQSNWQEQLRSMLDTSAVEITIETARPLDSYDWKTCQFNTKLLEKIGLSRRLAEQMVAALYGFLSDPLQVAEALKELDSQIAEAMDRQGISFTSADDPQEIFKGRDYWIAGPPPPGYQYRDKEKIISNVLWQKELKLGINLKGVPTFAGFVESKLADKLVKQGYIFKEDTDVYRMLLHGKHSHRIQLIAILSYLQKKALFSSISATEILQLLVTSKGPKEENGLKYSLWAFLIDMGFSLVHAKANPLMAYNCRAPFNIQSLIINFGKDLGLPHLAYCMRDSFWKTADKMVKRLGVDTPDPTTYRLAYLFIISSLSYNLHGPANIDDPYPFTLTPEEVQLQEKYQYFDEEALVDGIMRKVSTDEKAPSKKKYPT